MGLHHRCILFLLHHCHSISLSGRVPLLHPEIDEIIDYLKCNDQPMSILSSGLTLMDLDSKIWGSLIKLDESDSLNLNIDSYHQLTKNDYLIIEKNLTDLNCSFSLNYVDDEPYPIYPSKRARECLDMFQKPIELNITRPLNLLCEPEPKTIPYIECELYGMNNRIFVNPKGELLYCPLKQNDFVCSVDELKELSRDGALDYISKKSYECIKEISLLYSKGNSLMNCWSCLE